MAEFMIVQIKGPPPADLHNPYTTEKGAIEYALKCSRELGGEFLITRLVGRVFLRTTYEASSSET